METLVPLLICLLWGLALAGLLTIWTAETLLTVWAAERHHDEH